MTKRFSFIVSLLLVIFSLFGCNSLGNSEQDKTGSSSSVSNSLHNYNSEMVAEALEEHPNFPDLNPNESKTEEVTIEGNTVTVTYSTSTKINSHGPTTTDTDNGGTWEEATTADYFVTLKKEWETNNGSVEKYWKYRYEPRTAKLTMVESKDNDITIEGKG